MALPEEASRHAQERLGESIGDEAAGTIVGAIRELSARVEEVVRGRAMMADRIESMQSEMRAAFAAVNARFDAVDARFEGVNEQFVGVHARLDGVNEQFVGVHARLDGVHEQLRGTAERLVGHVSAETGKLRTEMAGLRTEMAGLRTEVAGILGRIVFERRTIMLAIIATVVAVASLAAGLSVAFR